ncbi:MAG: hypothetical protein C5B50_21300 [Verrucomicrobia bacterium]|nr:MAG: hypothetical protein C5B50_21300 [Verrucomicrobiota bacterium]
MRTKAILCAASLAAGALTSMAQVYSQNIVGYVNVAQGASGGYNYLSNPLDASPNNAATNVFPNPDPTQDYSGPYDGSQLQEWTGAGFKVSVFDSVTTDSTTGFTTLGGAQTACPNLPGGKGFLVLNSSGLTTITFVGQVRTGTSTMVLAAPAPLVSIGSMIPVSGDLIANLGFANPDPTQDYSGPLDGAQVQMLKVAPNGAALGYNVYVFDSVTTDTTTGFTTLAGAQVAAPQIPLAGGFLMGGLSSPYTWTQTLNP